MKLFILFLFYLLTGSIFAGNIQESEVPAKVKAYVTDHYPVARNIKWDFEEDEGIYEAEFKIGTLSHKLEILPDGILYASKEDIPVSSLPKSVIEYIKANYPDYKILGANKKVKEKTVIFDVGIKGKDASGRNHYRNICFDEQGNIIVSRTQTTGRAFWAI